MADVSVAVRAKRKRGRPRKDSNLGAALQSPDNNSSFMMKPLGAAEHMMYPSPSAAVHQDAEKTNCGDEGMVGSMVYGVVEGTFDAGFLISVRIGGSHAPFRGVVFQPRKVVAVTSANDVAPQAKMYQRRDIPVPVSYDGFGPAHPPPKQAVVRPHLPPVAPQYAPTSSYVAADVEGKLVPKQYQFGGNLRMVEEDEVMQAFEVSTSSGGSKSNLPTNGEAEPQQPPPQQQQQHNSMAAPPPQPSAFEIQQEEMICRETMDQLQEMNQNRSESQAAAAMKAQIRQTNLFQDVNFSENLFSTHQSREQESLAAPNLKLDLAFAVHKEKQMAAEQGGGIYSAMMKNPNIGYHQALVAGNPLLLPPDLMGGEPLEFMMDKPKSPRSSQEANMEVQSRLAGSGERFNGDEGGMNKLELATPQSSLSTRIADMDFVLSNAMQQPAQSHTNHG